MDTYITLASGKEMWDALEAKFGVSDAGSELYVMEQFLDYRMVEDRSVVEQAHEIHALAKDLKTIAKSHHVYCLTSLWLEVLSPSCHLFGGILLLL